MPNQKIGDIVRELRHAMGVTQQELATQMGAAVSSVALYEQGGTPGIKAIIALSDIAKKHGRPDLVDIFGRHLKARLGEILNEADFPVPDDPKYDVGIDLLNRIKNNPARLRAFLKFAKPEIAQMIAERKRGKKIEPQEIINYFKERTDHGPDYTFLDYRRDTKEKKS
jgi:transcriptional regulator with XRE-family HTH domain